MNHEEIVKRALALLPGPLATGRVLKSETLGRILGIDADDVRIALAADGRITWDPGTETAGGPKCNGWRRKS